jgi:hypothetical protein
MIFADAEARLADNPQRAAMATAEWDIATQ